MSNNTTWAAATEDEVPRLRVPPHSIEAEQAVLGGLLLDNRAFDRVGDVLQAGDFYSQQHRMIFEAISALCLACKPADVVTVFERLQGAGQSEQCGGLKHLNDLANCVPSASNARRHAEIVRERSALRELITVADSAATACFNPKGRSAGEVIDELSTRLLQLDRRQLSKVPRQLSELVVGRIDYVQALSEGTARSGTPTGITRLDAGLSGGLRPGNVYILAARPSVGKSSLAQFIALHVARHEGPVLMLSQEMPETEAADRALSALGSVNYRGLQTGKMEREDWERLTDACEIAQTIPYFIDDQPALRLKDIRAKARTVKNLKLLVLDYLQLSLGEGDNRVQEVGSLSRGLKALAKEMQIPLLVLSQLNRKAEERHGGEPELADLRDSGEIEQDADVAMFLWPLQDYDNGAKQIGVKLAKNRQGERGLRWALHFDGSRQRWGDSSDPMPNAAGKSTGKGRNL